MAKKLEILYEDNHIIAVVKPPGIISQADAQDSYDMLCIVKRYIKEKYDKPGKVYLGLIHRLDKPVGGLMILARTSKAASRLSEQQRKREIDKYYLAVITGRIRPTDGRIDGYIKKDREINISQMTDENEKGARFASLSYESIQEKNKNTLLAIKIHTGRSHQIRVQLSDAGHPIVGDRKYGKDTGAHHTVALWAYKTRFVHPVKNEPVVLVSMPEKKGIWNNFDIKEFL